MGILILQDWINRYVETTSDVPGFMFTGYLGNSVSISPQNTYGSNIQNPGQLDAPFQVPDCCLK